MFEFLFKYPRDLYARSELIYAGGWPGWLPWVLAVIALIAIVGFLWPRRRGASPFLLAGIGILQFAMVLAVLWALAQPTLATEELREGENSIAIALDRSESMAIDDGGTRLDRARGLIDEAIAATAELDFAVRRYAFDTEAEEVDGFDALTADGEATALAATLKRVLEQARQNPLAAVLLVSDGADTAGGLSTSDLADIASFGVPVHALAVGREAIPEDLELTDVALPAKVLPDSTVTARVSVRHDGPVNGQLRVYDNDELLASVPVALDGNAAATTLPVDFELADAGPHELSFSLSSSGVDPEPRNNQRRRLIEVADDSYRALYFEGEPRWEYKFMRRALDGSALAMESLLRVSPNKFYRQGIAGPEDLAEGFPTTRAELFSYDALIIGSVEAASLTPEQHALIRDFVAERGGSLLMIAGRNGLGNGGWAQTVVGDALPVRLTSSVEDSFRRIQVPVELTPAGMDSAILRFDTDPDENLTAWAGLPDIADYQLVGRLKPAAVTLLNARAQSGPQPLLITQSFGRGRSFVLATGGTWRWQMSLPVEDQRHEVFWQQLMRTLVAAAPSPISLTTSVDGGGILLRAEFRDDAFEPLGDVRVTAAVADAAGANYNVTLIPQANEPGIFAGRVEPRGPGTFYAEAVAVRDEAPIASARSSLVFETGQAEHFGIRSNPATLERIAAATGGSLLDPNDLGALAERLRFSTAGLTEIEERPIWDMPALFLLLLLLKAGEWLLRRRGGSI